MIPHLRFFREAGLLVATLLLPACSAESSRQSTTELGGADSPSGLGGHSDASGSAQANGGTDLGKGGLPPGNGGAAPGSGGALTGNGGALTGNGGALTGNGGALTGNGGALTGNGGALTGNGGAAPGEGGLTIAVGGNLAGGTSLGGTPDGGAATGGSGHGGTPAGSCPGSCVNAVEGSCSSPHVRITSIELGATLSYSTEETSVLPLAIAAKPGGGSRIAWMTGYSRYGSSSESQVHVADLDCNDEMAGTEFSFEAHDFQDIAADADGGVLLLTRDGEGGSDAQHCGDVNNLCVTPSDRPGCYSMMLVRHDCSGNEQWATPLTTTSVSTPLYESGSESNFGVWWYQHHGRLAYDGTNYGAYFCDSITVTNPSCDNKVDIHEGDRMQVVGPDGSLLDGHDSFGVGCSHSWTTRIVWDPREKHFVMVCATDNDCRIARPNPYRTLASATCDGTLFVGDLVNSSTDGYFAAWSYQGKIRLVHFTYDGDSDQTLDSVASGEHPHLVSYGPGRMLLAWQSGSGMMAKVLDSGTGADQSAEFAIDVPDHPWQAFKEFPDGSVAFASVGSASSMVQIARVMPCE